MSARDHECPRCGKDWHCEGCHTQETERLCDECMALPATKVLAYVTHVASYPRGAVKLSDGRILVETDGEFVECHEFADWVPVPAVAADGCRCLEIMTADPSRHFQGCPLRERYPVPLGAKTIYVAGGSSERFVIREYMNAVQTHGYAVTYDWTSIPHWDRECTDEELAEQARLDLDAIRRADVFWYVAPEINEVDFNGDLYYRGRSEGSHAELGAALILGKRVVVSGEIGSSRIFPRLAAHRFKLHAEALEFLRLRPWAEVSP